MPTLLTENKQLSSMPTSPNPPLNRLLAIVTVTVIKTRSKYTPIMSNPN